jgi:hypothetical protein
MVKKKRVWKKGEMNIAVIVSIIILILSFAILLLFYKIFPWSGTMTRETCHDSIVLRSSVNTGPIQSSKILPLKCQTEKICLTMSGEPCEGIGKASTTVRLKSDPEKAKEQIKNTLANAMFDCHSMLGEGKLSFMPNSVWSENYCLICARVALDKKARSIVGDISYGELYETLQKKRTSTGLSYLQYLHPGWTNWENIKVVFSKMQENSNSDSFKSLAFQDWKLGISNDNGVAVLSQMVSSGTWSSWASSAGTVVGVVLGTVLLSTGVGAPVGVTLIAGSLTVGTGVGAAVFWYSHPDGNSNYSPPSIIPYEITILQGLKCSSFETAP